MFMMLNTQVDQLHSPHSYILSLTEMAVLHLSTLLLELTLGNKEAVLLGTMRAWVVCCENE